MGQGQHAVGIARERRAFHASHEKENIRGGQACRRRFRQSKRMMERMIFPDISDLRFCAGHEKVGTFELDECLTGGKV